MRAAFLGAERAINYHSEDFVEVVREATQNRGVDVILDMVGGNYLLRELKALADDGRICLIAFLGGAKAEVNLAEMLRRRLTLTASTLRSRDIAFKAALARELERDAHGNVQLSGTGALADLLCEETSPSLQT